MPFPKPPVGSVASNQCHGTVALQKAYSPLCDVSASPPLAANYPLLHDAEYEIGIHAINLLYQASASNTSGSIIIGITGDTNAVVESQDVAVSGTHTQGSVQSLTLASTLQVDIYKYGSCPVLPAGTVLIATPSQGATNAGDYIIEVVYFKIQPGV